MGPSTLCLSMLMWTTSVLLQPTYACKEYLAGCKLFNFKSDHISYLQELSGVRL